MNASGELSGADVRFTNFRTTALEHPLRLRRVGQDRSYRPRHQPCQVRSIPLLPRVQPGGRANSLLGKRTRLSARGVYP